MTAIAACRTCGTEPLENARFCHGCGSPVQDGDTRAEYKQVTVLFADVVHSMDIAALVGPERLREIMAELADRCAAVVKRYGGTVLSLPVFFCDPRPQAVMRRLVVGTDRVGRCNGDLLCCLVQAV